MKRLFILFLAAFLMLPLPSCAKKETHYKEWSYNFSGSGVIYYQGKRYYLTYPLIDEPETMNYACIDPLCSHDENMCTAHFPDVEKTLVVEREGTLPLVYVFGQCNMYTYVDGMYTVDPGLRYTKQVTEYDTATGQQRIVAYIDEMVNVQNVLYLDGAIYMSGDSEHPLYDRIISVDTETGESAVMEYDDDVSLYGEFGGRIWSMTSRGAVLSCAPDFSDMRQEYDIGVTVPRTSDPTVSGCVSGNMLYFERDPERRLQVASWLSTADIYAVDLDDISSGERLIAEDVIAWGEHDGDLYYNVYAGDPDPDAPTQFYPFDSGDLYMYDHDSMASSLIVSDCGADINAIADVSDEYILFTGTYYGGSYHGDLVPEDGDVVFAYAILNIETGEWRIISKSLF